MGRHTKVSRTSVKVTPTWSGIFSQPRKNSEARSAKAAATKRSHTGLGKASFNMSPGGLMVSYAPEKKAAARKAGSKLKRRVFGRGVKTTFTGKRKRWL